MTILPPRTTATEALGTPVSSRTPRATESTSLRSSELGDADASTEAWAARGPTGTVEARRTRRRARTEARSMELTPFGARQEVGRVEGYPVEREDAPEAAPARTSTPRHVAILRLCGDGPGVLLLWERKYIDAWRRAFAACRSFADEKMISHQSCSPSVG